MSRLNVTEVGRTAIGKFLSLEATLILEVEAVTVLYNAFHDLDLTLMSLKVNQIVSERIVPLSEELGWQIEAGLQTHELDRASKYPGRSFARALEHPRRKLLHPG